MRNKVKHKKIKIGLIILAFLLVSAATLFSGTSGSVILQGMVPGILDVAVAAEPGSSSLDLTVNAADVLIATVTERSNKKAGYTVTLDSQNAANAGTGVAFFKSADPQNSDVLDYTLTYGGVPVVLSNGSAVVSDVNTKTTSSGTVNQVTISYDGAAVFLFEDTYSDTLTFTITAK